MIIHTDTTFEEVGRTYKSGIYVIRINRRRRIISNMWFTFAKKKKKKKSVLSTEGNLMTDHEHCNNIEKLLNLVIYSF